VAITVNIKPVQSIAQVFLENPYEPQVVASQAAAVADQIDQEVVQEFLDIPPLVAKTGGIHIEIKPKVYTILDACMELMNDPKKGILTIIRNSDGTQYIVRKFDPDTQKAILSGEDGQTFAPRITERECRLYKPIWR